MSIGRSASIRASDGGWTLHETAERHDSYEKIAPPHDWWDWYAAYMDARQSGSRPDDASATADRYMAEVKGVVVPSA